jgi:hypothetical protein
MRRRPGVKSGFTDDGAAVRRYDLGMQTWEYATIPLIIHATKAILDQWGADGWELVQVVPGPDGQGLVAYLKRPTS